MPLEGAITNRHAHANAYMHSATHKTMVPSSHIHAHISTHRHTHTYTHTLHNIHPHSPTRHDTTQHDTRTLQHQHPRARLIRRLGPFVALVAKPFGQQLGAVQIDGRVAGTATGSGMDAATGSATGSGVDAATGISTDTGTATGAAISMATNLTATCAANGVDTVLSRG